MNYNTLRKTYQPARVRLLLIAESPPPTSSDTSSSRHFYRSDVIRRGDRLFVNTIKSLYPEFSDTPENEIEEQKETLLRRFQADGGYMIEALEESQPHEATKKERQARIGTNLPLLIAKVKALASHDTGIVLIKSNVFDVAASPLREAGFRVLNTELVDYPGQFNQTAYRQKLQHLAELTTFGK